MEALRLFVPRMCAGSIIAFEELNCSNFPGESIAYLESFCQKASDSSGAQLIHGYPGSPSDYFS